MYVCVILLMIIMTPKPTVYVYVCACMCACVLSVFGCVGVYVGGVLTHYCGMALRGLFVCLFVYVYSVVP